MTRKTSVAAYNAIRESGALGNLQFQVYNFIFNHGPVTQRTAVEELTQGMPENEMKRSKLTPRFAELKKLGVIDDVGTAECKITGKTVLIWDVTDKEITKRPSVTLSEQIQNVAKRIDALLTKKLTLEQKLQKKLAKNAR